MVVKDMQIALPLIAGKDRFRKRPWDTVPGLFLPSQVLQTCYVAMQGPQMTS